MKLSSPSVTCRSRPRIRTALCVLGAGLWLPWLAPAGQQTLEGVTEAAVDVTLSLSVPGIVSVRHFMEWDQVQSNQVILELEHEIDSLDCHRRRLVMDNRQQDWEATQVVYEKSKSVSREDLDKKKLEYQVAEAEYQMACQQVALRQLRAPVSGLLADLPVETGEACEAYQPLARLVDPSQGHLICNLDYAQAAHLRLSQEVDLELDGAAGPVRVKGRVIFVSPVVDQASSLQEVKILFDNRDHEIRLGTPGRLILE